MAVFSSVCQRGQVSELVSDGNRKSVDSIRDLFRLVVTMSMVGLRVYLKKAKRYIRTKRAIITGLKDNFRPSVRGKERADSVG